MNKILSYIGLARRKGSLHIATDLQNRLARNKIYVLFIATDCPSKMKDKLLSLASDVNLISDFTSEELSSALDLVDVYYLGISDKELSKAILKFKKGE